MKIQTLYFSPTDNTKKIIKEIEVALMKKIIESNEKNMHIESVEYNITTPAGRQITLKFERGDIVIVGIPTYAGRVPKFLIDYINLLNGNGAYAVLVVTYGNRDYEDALLELKDLFKKNGFLPLAGGAFVGEHSSTELLATNRPDNDDFIIARQFGLKIGEKLASISAQEELKELEVPGKFPYVVKDIAMPPMGPETDEACIQCGVCANNCPTAAIDVNNCKQVDATKCIKCRSCVRKCPLKVKEIRHPAYQGMKNMLVENFGKPRKNPELFL